MNGLLAVLLLVSILSIQAAAEGNRSCKKLGGQCEPSTRQCKTINEAKCSAGKSCCVINKKMRSQNKAKKGRENKKQRKNVIKLSQKRICLKQNPKKCIRKGGKCIHYKDECEELIGENLCKGRSCVCCKAETVCKAKKKCKKKGGSCNAGPCNSMQNEIRKGCKGKGCRCCADGGPTECIITDKCINKGGECVTDPNDCQGSLGKGCKGKGCKCCVPSLPPPPPTLPPPPPTPVPQTPAPQTPAPQTPAPQTPAPQTPAPQTPAPQTSAPQTPAPQTPAPPTPAPSTVPPPTTKKPEVTTENPVTTMKPTTAKETATTPKPIIDPTPPSTTKQPATTSNDPATTMKPTTIIQPASTSKPTTVPPSPASTTKQPEVTTKSPTTTKEPATTPKPTTEAATSTAAANPTTELPSTSTSTAAKTVRCGIENSASTRIVNGVDVSVARKYSWQVGLRQSFTKYYCGGSIITNKHILTAAHCFYDFPLDGSPCSRNIPSEFYVGIGDHNQDETTENLADFGEPILAKQVFINPNYSCSTMNIDVAVIELSKSIDLLKHADVLHPICLPKDDSKTYAGVTATASGWGSTVGYDPSEEKAPVYPNILQEAQIPVLDDSDCKNSIGGFTEFMLCAATKDVGYKEGGKDSCQGDSGGPLIVKEGSQYAQIGIVSFGDGCASKGNYGAYTRVTKVLDWIKEQVGSETTYTLP